MKTKLTLLGIVGILLIIIILGYDVHHSLKDTIAKCELAKITAQTDLKQKTIDWVYKRSERINYATAIEIVEEAYKTGHPILVLAVVGAESNFTPSAVSNKGAIGLGQIMYPTWGKKLEEQKIIKTRRDLFGVQENLIATDYILKVMMKESKGDVIETLYRYLGIPKLKYSNSIFVDYVALSVLGNEK